MPPTKEKEEIGFSLNGKKWKIRFVKSKEMPRSFGECDDPSVKKPEIWINRNLDDVDKLDTIIHEMLHATHPELSEESVYDTSKKITEVLKRLGFRFN